MPPITASSCFNFATSREVRSKRFITLVFRIAVLMVPLTCRTPCRRKRREDQRPWRLRGDGLLDGAVGDELELIEPGDGVVLHGKRVQNRAHGAADQGLAVV